MGQSFIHSNNQPGAQRGPTVYRSIDGVAFTVNDEGQAVGLDGNVLAVVPSGNIYIAGDGPLLGFDDADGTPIVVHSDGSYTLPGGTAYALDGVWRPWDYQLTSTPPDPCAGIISPGSDDLYVTGTSGAYAGVVDIATLPGFANMTGPPDTVMFALTSDVTNNQYSWLTFDPLPDAACKTVTGGSISITMGIVTNPENLILIVYYGASGTAISPIPGSNPPPSATTTYALAAPQALALSTGLGQILLGVEDHNAVASVFNIDAIKLTLDWV